MSKRALIHLKEKGHTLAEFMVAVGVSILILMGLALASIALQRAFAGSDQYATAQNSELRAMDYITRDLRRAGGLTGCSARTSEPLRMQHQSPLTLLIALRCVPS